MTRHACILSNNLSKFIKRIQMKSLEIIKHAANPMSSKPYKSWGCIEVGIEYMRYCRCTGQPNLSNATRDNFTHITGHEWKIH